MKPDESSTAGVGRPPPAVAPAQPARSWFRRKLPHYQRDGKTYYLTIVTRNRWILPPEARDAILEGCLGDHGRRYHLHAAVVMPDHVHLLLTPIRDEFGATFGLQEIVGSLKGATAHRANRVLGRSGAVWQQEWFDHQLRNDESLRQKGEYIIENPVRARLVERPQDYEWLWIETADQT